MVQSGVEHHPARRNATSRDGMISAAGASELTRRSIRRACAAAISSASLLARAVTSPAKRSASLRSSAVPARARRAGPVGGRLCGPEVRPSQVGASAGEAATAASSCGIRRVDAHRVS